MARPETYTEDLGIEIAERIAEGGSLKSIAEDAAMPSVRTMLRWSSRHPEFDERLARARLEKADLVFEDAMTIADEPVVGQDQATRQRLRVETRLKIAARLRPEKYGEKLAVGGAVGLPPVIQPIDTLQGVQRLAFLLAKGAALLDADDRRDPSRLGYVADGPA